MPSHHISGTQNSQNELLKIELELLLSDYTSEIKQVVDKLAQRVKRLEQRLDMR